MIAMTLKMLLIIRELLICCKYFMKNKTHPKDIFFEQKTNYTPFLEVLAHGVLKLQETLVAVAPTQFLI